MIVNTIFGLAIFLFLLLFAESIIIQFFGAKYEDSINIIKILSLLPLFFGIQMISYMFILSHKKEVFVNYVYLTALCIFIPIIYLVMKYYGVMYGVSAIFTGEALISLLMLFYALKIINKMRYE